VEQMYFAVKLNVRL